MNNFREALRTNYRQNVDEVMYRKLYLEMKNLCQKLNKRNKNAKSIEEKEKIEEQIKQIEERMEYLTDAFNDFDATIEKINLYEMKKSKNAQITQVDLYLQKAIQKVSIELGNRLRGEKEKVQVIERENILKKIFENFEYYSKQEKEEKNSNISEPCERG